MAVPSSNASSLGGPNGPERTAGSATTSLWSYGLQVDTSFDGLLEQNLNAVSSPEYCSDSDINASNVQRSSNLFGNMLSPVSENPDSPRMGQSLTTSPELGQSPTTAVEEVVAQNVDAGEVYFAPPQQQQNHSVPSGPLTLTNNRTKTNKSASTSTSQAGKLKKNKKEKAKYYNNLQVGDLQPPNMTMQELPKEPADLTKRADHSADSVNTSNASGGSQAGGQQQHSTHSNGGNKSSPQKVDSSSTRGAKRQSGVWSNQSTSYSSSKEKPAQSSGGSHGKNTGTNSTSLNNTPKPRSRENSQQYSSGGMMTAKQHNNTSSANSSERVTPNRSRKSSARPSIRGSSVGGGAAAPQFEFNEQRRQSLLEQKRQSIAKTTERRTSVQDLLRDLSSTCSGSTSNTIFDLNQYNLVAKNNNLVTLQQHGGNTSATTNYKLSARKSLASAISPSNGGNNSTATGGPPPPTSTTGGDTMDDSRGQGDASALRGFLFPGTTLTGAPPRQFLNVFEGGNMNQHDQETNNPLRTKRHSFAAQTETSVAKSQSGTQLGPRSDFNQKAPLVQTERSWTAAKQTQEGELKFSAAAELEEQILTMAVLQGVYEQLFEFDNQVHSSSCNSGTEEDEIEMRILTTTLVQHDFYSSACAAEKNSTREKNCTREPAPLVQASIRTQTLGGEEGNYINFPTTAPVPTSSDNKPSGGTSDQAAAMVPGDTTALSVSSNSSNVRFMANEEDEVVEEEVVPNPHDHTRAGPAPRTVQLQGTDSISNEQGGDAQQKPGRTWQGASIKDSTGRSSDAAEQSKSSQLSSTADGVVPLQYYPHLASNPLPSPVGGLGSVVKNPELYQFAVSMTKQNFKKQRLRSVYGHAVDEEMQKLEKSCKWDSNTSNHNFQANTSTSTTSPFKSSSTSMSHSAGMKKEYPKVESKFLKLTCIKYDDNLLSNMLKRK
ncbi:unnamed protein product [Amoebophrya sp. A120]|nr:unnamed protein product [Amoebophrya sp. A120]|eukprot:GSA120T00009279001.1